MNKKSPCADCTKRSATCHPTCEPYLIWAEEKRNKRKAVIDARVRKYGEAEAYFKDRNAKIKKRMNNERN